MLAEGENLSSEFEKLVTYRPKFIKVHVKIFTEL